MQTRYNKALNHFYQAQTNKYMKLEEGSDGNESEVSADEDAKLDLEAADKEGGTTELEQMNNNGLLPNYSRKKKAKVIPVQPGGICTKKFCLYLILWVLLFVLSVVGLTYFIERILERVSNPNEKYIRGPFKIAHNETEYSQLASSKASFLDSKKVVGCNDFATSLVWYRTLDKLTTEAAVRKIDANNDGIEDFVIGFGTGVDGYNVPESVCQKYFPNIFPCFGGVLALDGKDGQEMWRHYTKHEVFAVNCNGDLNRDGTPDCLIAGRGSTFESISGKDGTLLWEFKNNNKDIEVMNLYTAQYIQDVDGDGISDVLQAYGGDPLSEAYSKDRLIGRMMILSGKTGKVLREDETPDKRETYFSPLVYSSSNGKQIMVFGTGGETHPGGLWAIPLLTFYSSGLKLARKIFDDKEKGLMNPPVLVDINKDGQVDLLMAAFGAPVVALDGVTFKEIWRRDFLSSESYSIPGAGYFDEDDTVDFMVRYNVGEGFPVYYHSNVTVLNGKTGQPITDPGQKSSGAANASPLSVSVEGFGNDLFLYWIADCLGHEGEGGKFQFVEGTNVHEQSRADTCKLRYKTKSFSALNVMNRRTGFPGVSVYNSEENASIEYGSGKQRRHIGIPDHGGFQRIIATGALAAPLSITEDSTSSAIDVVFSVYWIYPAKVRLMVENVMKCVKEYRKQAKSGMVQNKIDVEKNRENGHFDEGDTAVDFCFKVNNVTASEKEQIYNSQSSYDPNNVHMGKMTVYRYRISCLCKNLRPEETCAKILPIEKQAWAGYMGSLGNGFFFEDESARRLRMRPFL